MKWSALLLTAALVAAKGKGPGKWRVCPTDSDADYQSLGAAVAALTGPTELQLCAGTYTEAPVTVNTDGVTISGEGDDTVIAAQVSVLANGVTIRNVHFENSAPTDWVQVDSWQSPFQLNVAGDHFELSKSSFLTTLSATTNQHAFRFNGNGAQVRDNDFQLNYSGSETNYAVAIFVGDSGEDRWSSTDINIVHNKAEGYGYVVKSMVYGSVEGLQIRDNNFQVAANWPVINLLTKDEHFDEDSDDTYYQDVRIENNYLGTTGSSFTFFGDFFPDGAALKIGASAERVALRGNDINLSSVDYSSAVLIVGANDDMSHIDVVDNNVWAGVSLVVTWAYESNKDDDDDVWVDNLTIRGNRVVLGEASEGVISNPYDNGYSIPVFSELTVTDNEFWLPEWDWTPLISYGTFFGNSDLSRNRFYEIDFCE